MNKILLKITSLIFCLFIAQDVYAASLTEANVLVSVEAHYPLIEAAAANIRKARAEYLAAKGKFDPTIRSQLISAPHGPFNYNYSNTELIVPIPDSGNNFFTGYRVGRGDFPVYYQDRKTFNDGEMRAGVEFPLLRDKDIDSRRAHIQQNKIKTIINEEELKLVKLQAKQAASVTYWDWYVEGKKLRLQHHLLELAQVRQTALDQSVKAGDIANIEAVDNQRIIIQRKNAVAAQTVAFQKAALILSLFYRDNTGNPILSGLDAIPGSLNKTVPTGNKLFNTNANSDFLIDQHPAIKRLDEQRNLSYVDLKTAKNKLLPMLNNRVFLAQDFGNSNNAPVNRTTVNYEIVFEIPLFQREAKGEIAAAKNLLSRINEEQRLQHDNLAMLLRDALNQIQAQQTIVKASLNEINLAAQVENAENIRFQHGDSNLFLLNQREVATLEANISYLDSIGNYNKALANLRYAMGNNQ